MIKCKYCFKDLDNQDKFCVHCGAPTEFEEPIKRTSINEKELKPSPTVQQTVQPTVRPTPVVQPIAQTDSPVQENKSQNLNPSKSKTSKKPKGCGCLLAFLVIAILIITVIAVLLMMFDFDEDKYDDPNPTTENSTYDNEALLSGQFSKESTTITKDRASLSVSSDYIQYPLEASISATGTVRPFDGLEMDIYEIYMEDSDNYSGLYNIILPYDSSKIPSGQTPEDSLVLMHYNEVSQEWEKPIFSIDKASETIHFETSHLSPAAVAVVNVLGMFDPNSQHNVKGGTVDISSGNRNLQIPIKTIIPSSNVNANFGVFQLTYEDHLLNKITGYNETLLFENLKSMDSELNTFLALNSDSDLLAYTLQSMGIGASFSEYVSAASDNFKTGTPGTNLATNISHVGMIITTGQFINDIDKGKPVSSSFWGLIKGIVYYKGADATSYIVGKAATAAVGVTAGEFVAVGLAGMWVFEQAFMPVEDILDYTSGGGLHYHQRYISSMKDYLAATDPHSENDWYKIVQTLHEESINTLKPGEDPALHFKSVMENYIKDYAQQYFDQPSETRVEWLIKTDTGGLYGHPDLIHYYNFGQDQLQLKEYEDAITGNKKYDIKTFGNLQDYDYETFTKEYEASLDSTNAEALIRVPGTNREYAYNFTDQLSNQTNIQFADWYMKNWADNKVLQDEIKAIYIKEIFNDYTTIHLETLTRIEVNKIWHKVCSEMDTLVADLNKEYTIEFIDESLTEDKPISSLNGYVLVPNISDYDKWKVTLDEEGKASLKFTLVEYLTNGNFIQFNMYNLIDGAGSLSVASPVSVYDFQLSGDHILISLNPSEEEIVGLYSYKNEYDYFFGFAPDGTFASGTYAQLFGTPEFVGTYTFDSKTKEGLVDDGAGGFRIVLNGDIVSVYTNDGAFFADYYRVPKE